MSVIATQLLMLLVHQKKVEELDGGGGDGNRKTNKWPIQTCGWVREKNKHNTMTVENRTEAVEWFSWKALG